jgi:hypothetical protein
VIFGFSVKGGVAHISKASATENLCGAIPMQIFCNLSMLCKFEYGI